MRTYRYFDKPLEVHGIPFFSEKNILERVPAEVRERVPSLRFLGRRTPGARICFRTNSTKIILNMEFETFSVDHGMSIKAAQSANVLIGDRQNARFAGLLSPKTYNDKVAEAVFSKSSNMEEVTVWLPRNEVISSFTVSVEDDAVVESPTPYKYPPMLYYGSSITEGGAVVVLQMHITLLFLSILMWIFIISVFLVQLKVSLKLQII